MIRALILSGGVSHDFDASTAALQGVLADARVQSEVATDPDAGMARLADFDLLVLNLLRWRMTDERHAPLRPRWSYATGAAMRDGMARHLAKGRGVFALHTASICFDDWPAWGELLGAAWQWDISRHDPPGPALIEFGGPHALTAGLSPFETSDEIYTGLKLAGDARPLAWATQRGETVRHPVLLAHTVAGGRVVYDALGHDANAISRPAHAALIRRGVRWAANLPAGDHDDA